MEKHLLHFVLYWRLEVTHAIYGAINWFLYNLELSPPSMD